MTRLNRGILAAVLVVVSRPRLTLLLAGLLLAGCLALANARLNISTDQNKLFDPTVQFFKDYLRFNRQFPENEAIYVVIQSTHPKDVPPVPRWTAIADDIAKKLRAMPEHV